MTPVSDAVVAFGWRGDPVIEIAKVPGPGGRAGRAKGMGIWRHVMVDVLARA